MQNSTRERLIPIVKDSLMKHIGKSCNLAENIVDDLVASGVIVLPYKIGSKLYRNVVGEKEPQEYTVVGFYCEEEPKLVSCEFKYNDKTYSHTYDIEDEGKYYRTTKAQAEQKLKELSENGNL